MARVASTLLVSLWIMMPAAHAEQAANAEPVQSAQPVQIERLQLYALESCDLGDYRGAAELLATALARAEAAGLASEPLHARTHALLGAVYASGLGDQAKAIEHFTAALRLDQGLIIEPRLDTEAARAALARAREALAPRENTGTCADVQGIEHEQRTRQVSTGTAIAITCTAGAELKGSRMVLLYQVDDAPFVEVPMVAQGTCEHKAEIPAAAVQGAVVRYYVQATRPDGRVLARRGNARAPYEVTVVLREDAPLVSKARQNEVPEELRGRKRAPRGAGCAGCAAGRGDGHALGIGLLACALLLARRRRGSRADQGAGLRVPGH